MVAERVAAPHHALSTASSTSRADWDSFEFLPQLLEMRPVRFAYAGGLVASILAGYEPRSLRRGRLSAAKDQERLRAYRTRRAGQTPDAVLRRPGPTIQIGRAHGGGPGPDA